MPKTANDATIAAPVASGAAAGGGAVAIVGVDSLASEREETVQAFQGQFISWRFVLPSMMAPASFKAVMTGVRRLSGRESARSRHPPVVLLSEVYRNCPSPAPGCRTGLLPWLHSW